MNDIDQRRCARVPFRTPLHVRTPQGILKAESTDMSRTGVGIRIHVPGLESSNTPGLAEAALQIHRRLGRAFDVDLNPDVLGSLLTKRTVVVRLGDAVDADGNMVLGCRFTTPLNETEMVSLGVPLPPAHDDEEEWVPRADLPAPHFRDPTPSERPAPRRKPKPEAAAEVPEPKAEPAAPTPRADDDDPFARPEIVGGGGAGWRAHLSGTVGDAPTLTGRVDRVTGEGVVLRVWCDDLEVREIFDAPDVVTAILAFTQAYGQEIGLKLANGASHVWTGPTVLTEMALPPNPGDPVYLNLRFGRHLRPAELRSLGLERIESA